MKRTAYILLLAFIGPVFAADSSLELAKIKKDTTTGFSNAGWKYDRYKELKSLDAHTAITVADIKGPPS